jgi:hypothetical protein
LPDDSRHIWPAQEETAGSTQSGCSQLTGNGELDCTAVPFGSQMNHILSVLNRFPLVNRAIRARKSVGFPKISISLWAEESQWSSQKSANSAQKVVSDRSMESFLRRRKPETFEYF